MRVLRFPPFAILAALGLAFPASGADQAVSAAVQSARPAGPLDVNLRTDMGRDVHLRMETAYSTQDLGNRLTREQQEKLDTIRSEAPSKFQILSCLFPQQIA